MSSCMCEALLGVKMRSLHSPSKEGKKISSFDAEGAEKVELVVGMCMGKAVCVL